MDLGVDKTVKERQDGRTLCKLTLGRFAIVDREDRLSCTQSPRSQTFFVVFRRHGDKPATWKIENEISGLAQFVLRFCKEEICGHRAAVRGGFMAW